MISNPLMSFPARKGEKVRWVPDDGRVEPVLLFGSWSACGLVHFFPTEGLWWEVGNCRIIVEAASAEVQQPRVGKGWKKGGKKRMLGEKCCQWRNVVSEGSGVMRSVAKILGGAPRSRINRTGSAFAAFSFLLRRASWLNIALFGLCSCWLWTTSNSTMQAFLALECSPGVCGLF